MKKYNMIKCGIAYHSGSNGSKWNVNYIQTNTSMILVQYNPYIYRLKEIGECYIKDYILEELPMSTSMVTIYTDVIITHINYEFIDRPIQNIYGPLAICINDHDDIHDSGNPTDYGLTHYNSFLIGF